MGMADPWSTDPSPEAQLRQLRRRAEEAEAKLAKVEHERNAFCQGLTYLSQAMDHGTCQAIRDRWRGNTPEEWCGVADQLHVLLAERDDARSKLAALALARDLEADLE